MNKLHKLKEILEAKKNVLLEERKPIVIAHLQKIIIEDLNNQANFSDKEREDIIHKFGYTLGSLELVFYILQQIEELESESN